MTRAFFTLPLLGVPTCDYLISYYIARMCVRIVHNSKYYCRIGFYTGYIALWQDIQYDTCTTHYNS
jgi:hypothetical protein